MKMSMLRSFYLCVVLSSLALNSTVRAEQFELLPKRLTAGIGLNFRAKALFSQERYFQESYVVSAGLHWPVRLLASDLLIHGSYEKFTDLPRSESQLGINPKESRLSMDVGIENHTYTPIGASLGVVWIKKQFELNPGSYVLDGSTQSNWQQSLNAPVLRVWTGVPLIPDRLNLNVGIQRVFVTQPADEQFSYGGEFRFEF